MVTATTGEVLNPLTPLPQVSYKEFDFGHLDFTFAVKEELKLYLMRLLGK